MSRLVRLCHLGALVDGQPVRIDIDGHRIAAVRIEDDVYAIGDRCSHANFSLSEGYLDIEQCSLECPKHGSNFSLVTGEPGSFPAIKPVPVYAVTIDEDDVIVELPEDDQ